MTMWSKLKHIITSWFKKKTHACKVYERVGRYASLTQTTVCRLHNPVSRVSCPDSLLFCGMESAVPAFNFDEVKEVYCNKAKINSLPSVDAVMYKEKRFLFVEIKSWQNFERYQIKPGDSQDVIQQKIAEKARDFKLKSKLEKSMEICKKILKDEHLFEKMPVTYVLVTDVDTIVDPLARFKGKLRALSYKSVYIPLYNRASNAQLSVVGMDVRYVFCRKFDDFYASL